LSWRKTLRTQILYLSKLLIIITIIFARNTRCQAEPLGNDGEISQLEVPTSITTNSILDVNTQSRNPRLAGSGGAISASRPESISQRSQRSQDEDCGEEGCRNFSSVGSTESKMASVGMTEGPLSLNAVEEAPAALFTSQLEGAKPLSTYIATLCMTQPQTCKYLEFSTQLQYQVAEFALNSTKTSIDFGLLADENNRPMARALANCITRALNGEFGEQFNNLAMAIDTCNKNRVGAGSATERMVSGLGSGVQPFISQVENVPGLENLRLARGGGGGRRETTFKLTDVVFAESDPEGDACKNPSTPEDTDTCKTLQDLKKYMQMCIGDVEYTFDNGERGGRDETSTMRQEYRKLPANMTTDADPDLAKLTDGGQDACIHAAAKYAYNMAYINARRHCYYDAELAGLADTVDKVKRHSVGFQNVVASASGAPDASRSGGFCARLDDVDVDIKKKLSFAGFSYVDYCSSLQHPFKMLIKARFGSLQGLTTAQCDAVLPSNAIDPDGKYSYTTVLLANQDTLVLPEGIKTILYWATVKSVSDYIQTVAQLEGLITQVVNRTQQDSSFIYPIQNLLSASVPLETRTALAKDLGELKKQLQKYSEDQSRAAEGRGTTVLTSGGGSSSRTSSASLGE
jgi:hypothetical protein